jgi:quercetin 2,3-dioxygenase
VICGAYAGTQGPVQEVIAEPLYLDIMLPAEKTWSMHVPREHTILVYVYEGALQAIKTRECALYGPGTELEVTAVQKSRFLVLAGAPLQEPISWYGPIVMNSSVELSKAFQDLEEGTFLGQTKQQHPGKVGKDLVRRDGDAFY